MRAWVRLPVLPWGLFLEGEDSQGDHGLGSLEELGFKAPPGTSYSYITIHLIGTTELRLMGVLTPEVGYNSAQAGRGDHEAHKGHVVALKKKLNPSLGGICSTRADGHGEGNSRFSQLRESF
jgi:hypothetical protein